MKASIIGRNLGDLKNHSLYLCWVNFYYENVYLLWMPVIDYLLKNEECALFTALRLRTKSFEIIQTERFSSTFTLYVYIFFCTTKSFFSLLLISGS